MCVLLFFFVFFNLTCVLKKSQSWGLSSDLEDKKERAAGQDQSQPSVIFLIHIILHLNARVQEVQTSGNLFKCTQPAEERRYNFKMSCLLYHLFFLKKKASHSFSHGCADHLSSALAGVECVKGTLPQAAGYDSFLSLGKMNGKLTSGTQHFCSVTFHVWLTELLFCCILQQKTNPQRAF